MNDDILYENAVEMIDSNMGELRKKQVRELLLFKADQHINSA